VTIPMIYYILLVFTNIVNRELKNFDSAGFLNVRLK